MQIHPLLAVPWAFHLLSQHLGFCIWKGRLLPLFLFPHEKTPRKYKLYTWEVVQGTSNKGVEKWAWKGRKGSKTNKESMIKPLATVGNKSVLPWGFLSVDHHMPQRDAQKGLALNIQRYLNTISLLAPVEGCWVANGVYLFGEFWPATVGGPSRPRPPENTAKNMKVRQHIPQWKGLRGCLSRLKWW